MAKISQIIFSTEKIKSDAYLVVNKEIISRYFARKFRIFKILELLAVSVGIVIIIINFTN